MTSASKLLPLCAAALALSLSACHGEHEHDTIQPRPDPAVVAPLAAAQPGAPGAPGAAAGPARGRGESIYLLDATLTDAKGEAKGVDVGRGHPTMIGMFYASCRAACPLMIRSIQRIEKQLSPEVRSDVRVVLVSFDAEKDSPEALQAAADRFGVDASRWTLGRTGREQVRELAALFGIQYRKLDDGSFNHTSPVIVLDRDGKPVARLEAIGDPEEPIVEALTRLSASR